MSMPANPQALASSAAGVPARRGSFVVRVMLAPLVLRQHPRALALAGNLALALPLAQVALLVGVLKAEWWQGLLGLEGMVIALLASSQFRRAGVESRLVGYGIALINAAALGAIGLVLGGHLLWITGAIGMAAITWLVFAPTRVRTVRAVATTFMAVMLLLAAGCGYARYTLETSRTEPEPARRAAQLQVAWLALLLRGGNGTERALLRLRQAQAAFAGSQFDAAFAFAHDGGFDSHGGSRVPATAIGADLLDSLLRIKAQAYYNARWHKQDRIWVPIASDPLPQEVLGEESVQVRWGW